MYQIFKHFFTIKHGHSEQIFSRMMTLNSKENVPNFSDDGKISLYAILMK